MQKLDAIQHAVNEARVTQGNTVSQAPAARKQPRGRVVLKRLFIPGQVVRFSTQASWEKFRSAIPGDAYEIIDHTDPLGFDGGAGVVIDGASNPRNFLRRDQLPNKTIDMTNVYRPSVIGRVPSDSMRRNIIPFLGYRNGQYYPAPIDGIPPGIAIRPLPSETVTSVLQPKLFTYQEASEYMLSLGNWENIVVFNSQQAWLTRTATFSGHRRRTLTSHSQKTAAQRPWGASGSTTAAMGSWSSRRTPPAARASLSGLKSTPLCNGGAP